MEAVKVMFGMKSGRTEMATMKLDDGEKTFLDKQKNLARMQQNLVQLHVTSYNVTKGSIGSIEGVLTLVSSEVESIVVTPVWEG